MSTNMWVFSLQRTVLSGNSLEEEKVDGSGRGYLYNAGGCGKSQQGPKSAENRDQNLPSHFTEGKTVTAGGMIDFAKNPAAGFMAALGPELPSLNSLFWFFSGPCSVFHMPSFGRGPF